MYSALRDAELGIRVLSDLLERKSEMGPERSILWFIHTRVLQAEEAANASKTDTKRQETISPNA